MKSVKIATEVERTKRLTQMPNSSVNEGEGLRDVKVKWKNGVYGFC